MRKALSWILIWLGVFLLFAAGVALWPKYEGPKGFPRSGGGMVNTISYRLDYRIVEGELVYLVVFDRPVGKNFSGGGTPNGFQFRSGDGSSFEISVSDTSAYSGGQSYPLSSGRLFLVQLGKNGDNNIAQSNASFDLPRNRDISDALVAQVDSLIEKNVVIASFLDRSYAEQDAAPQIRPR